MKKFDFINWNINAQPIPSIFNEGYSQYETLCKLLYQINQYIENMNLAKDQLDDLEEKKQSIESYLDDIKNKRKLDENGDFTGSWFGITHPTQSDEGLATTVQNHTSEISDLKQRRNNRLNMIESGMIADGVFDNLALFNTLKSQYPTREFYFPYVSSGIYYFSSSRPLLTGVNISCDPNVKFKVDSSPDIKNMQLLTPLTINNTVHQTNLEKHSNINYEKVLTNVGSAMQDISNNEVYANVDLTTYINKVYEMYSGAITTDGTATKSSNLISWNSDFVANPQIIMPPSLVSGKCYEINVVTPPTGVTVGFFLKTSTGEIIRLQNPIGTTTWQKRRITPPSTVSESSDFTTPNGGAYGCVAGQEQNFSIYYKDSSNVYFICSDYTIFAYHGEYGTVTDIGFLMLNGTNTSQVSFKSAIEISNYKYHSHKPIKCCLLGDSISFGAWNSLPPEKILPIMLQNISGIGKVTIDNISISGRSSTDWKNDINNYNFSVYDYVLIMLGTNDLQGLTDTTTYTSNLEYIANKIKVDGAKPIFQVFPIFTNSGVSGVIGVTTSNYAYHAKYTQALKRWCIGQGYEFGNARRNFGSNISWYGDNIHPTEEGQIAILKSWAEVLSRVLLK